MSQSLTELDYSVLSLTRVLDQARDGGGGIIKFRSPREGILVAKWDGGWGKLP